MSRRLGPGVKAQRSKGLGPQGALELLGGGVRRETPRSILRMGWWRWIGAVPPRVLPRDASGSGVRLLPAQPPCLAGVSRV